MFRNKFSDTQKLKNLIFLKCNMMKWFFGLSVDGARDPFSRTLKLLFKTLMHPLIFLKTIMNARWSTNMVIFLVMQTVDNAMKIVWKDTIFGGKIKIDNSGHKKVPAFIPVGQDVMERYARKVAGIPQNILLEVFFNRPTTAHLLGGCPMSDSPDSGMIDSNLKVHGYPDFLIVDGSAVQGNIGVNPSLTITALAEYAMSWVPIKDGRIIPEISKQLKMFEEEWIRMKFN